MAAIPCSQWCRRDCMATGGRRTSALPLSRNRTFVSAPRWTTTSRSSEGARTPLLSTTGRSPPRTCAGVICIAGGKTAISPGQRNLFVAYQTALPPSPDDPALLPHTRAGSSGQRQPAERPITVGLRLQQSGHVRPPREDRAVPVPPERPRARGAPRCRAPARRRRGFAAVAGPPGRASGEQFVGCAQQGGVVCLAQDHSAPELAVGCLVLGRLHVRVEPPLVFGGREVVPVRSAASGALRLIHTPVGRFGLAELECESVDGSWPSLPRPASLQAGSFKGGAGRRRPCRESALGRRGSADRRGCGASATPARPAGAEP